MKDSITNQILIFLATTQVTLILKINGNDIYFSGSMSSMIITNIIFFVKHKILEKTRSAFPLMKDVECQEKHLYIR
jgi:hypothetical protein